jgi:hypothetical protein
MLLITLLVITTYITNMTIIARLSIFYMEHALEAENIKIR